MMKNKWLKSVLLSQFTWPVWQSWQKQSAAFGTMEEIYANVDCAKLSYPTHSTNYTGKKEVAENKTDVFYHLWWSLIFCTVHCFTDLFFFSGPRSSKRGFNLVIILSLGLLSFFLLIGLIILGVSCESGSSFEETQNSISLSWNNFKKV